MEFNHVFTEKDVKVEFKEDEHTSLYCLKNKEPYFLAVDIIVFNKDGKKISQYYRNFDKKVMFQHYNSFMKKFLENPEYRKSFLLEGENHWEEVIKFEKYLSIHQKCDEIITKINKATKLRFKDFANLKTFGNDSFSTMKKEKLNTFISISDIEYIEKELNEEKLILTAMRWRARGLKVNHAVRKVKTDLEIQQHMKS